MKYIKKPVVVEAFQFDGTEECAIDIASNQNFNGKLEYSAYEFIGFSVMTNRGLCKVNPSDYVIKGIDNEYYPCPADVFKQTYKPHVE